MIAPAANSQTEIGMTTRRGAIKGVAGVLGLLVSSTSASLASAAQGARLTFEIYKDTKGEFRWTLKAGNRQVLATPGEGYTTKAACRKSIESIKRGAATASIVEVP